MAILSTIQVAAQRDAPITRTNWLWGRADWDGLCDELQQTPWSTILVNDVDTQGSPPYMQLKSAPLWSYAPLTWSSCPPSYLSLLDKVQARAQQLIRLKALQDQLLPPLQPLQQRRGRSRSVRRLQGHTSSMSRTWLLSDSPGQEPHGHTTRTAATRDHQLIVPFARTETSLRSFLPRYTRMWNRMVQQTQLHSTSSLRPSRVL
ncbi:hypothetical protein GWK47_049877 [Chionoecetes opilio]|uniref:Uncharacterized protein n=1 Tax=Chionoecetes opilio TaxID=41210 RepID=A0A8J5CT40_CHIOP|nr:hypothetical protein GWK47_049877 [Chionoecetes opilio]